MAFKPRSRTIKPSFFVSEDLSALSFEARLVFAGLWTLADREGRLEDKPGQIKVYLMPYDQVDMDAILTNLSKERLIERYQVNGQAVINIPTFLLHQKVHPHEAQSLLPAPQQDSEMSLNVMTSHDKSRQGLPLQEKEIEKEIEKEVEKDDKIPYSEIISDLNEVLGTKYREKTEETRQGIRRWWKQGFRLEDFKAVHRIKKEEWAGTEQAVYLRPSILYGPKFENYLNQASVPQQEIEHDGLPPRSPSS